MKLLKTTGVIGISAVLYFLSFPPFPTGFLACVFLVPFFALLESGDFKKGARLGYLLGFLSIGGLLYWLACNTGSSAGQALAMYVSTIVYLSVAWCIFGGLLGLICRAVGPRGLWAAPFLWTSMEFVQSQGSLGFTWHSLATTQAHYTPIIQFISSTGMFGLSFWAITLNVLIYMAWRTFREENGSARKKILAKYLAATAVLILLPLIYGLVVTPPPSTGEGDLDVALVQPNIEPNQKWRERNVAYLELMKMTMSLEESHDLIVWPESAVPFVLRENPRRRDTIRSMLKDREAVLLAGISDKTDNSQNNNEEKKSRKTRADRIKGSKYRKVNTMHLIRPETPDLEKYEKLHLVPFGEYVPSFLGFLEDMMMNVGSGIFVPGKNVHVFDIPCEECARGSVKTAAVICLESNYPSLVNRFIDAGAQLLVVVTNDTWYDGTTETYQHSMIATLRAVEHRIPILRCANSGISGIIDPNGRYLEKTESREQALLTGRIEIPVERSFFSAHGHWFPGLTLIVSALAVLAAAALLVRRRASKQGEKNESNDEE